MKPKPTEKPTAPLAPGAVPFYRKEISVPPALRNIPRKPILLVGAGIVTIGASFSLFSREAASDSSGTGWSGIPELILVLGGLALVVGGVLLWTARTRPGRELGRVDLYFYGPLSGLANQATDWVIGVILLILLLPFLALAGGVSWLIERIGFPLGLIASVSAVAVAWFAAGFVRLPGNETRGPAARSREPESESTLPPKVCPGCAHVYEGAARVVRTCRTCGEHLPD